MPTVQTGRLSPFNIRVSGQIVSELAFDVECLKVADYCPRPYPVGNRSSRRIRLSYAGQSLPEFSMASLANGSSRNKPSVR